jgi:hypothetical protein
MIAAFGELTVATPGLERVLPSDAAILGKPEIPCSPEQNMQRGVAGSLTDAAPDERTWEVGYPARRKPEHPDG